MRLIYNISVSLYVFAIKTVSPINKKAKLWLSGRKNIFKNIKNTVNPNDRIIWLHAASLGEFEQGRPLIEHIKSNYPEFKILLTFFSPSGYEVRKNFDKADYIFYLPKDTKSNAQKFIELVNPEKAFFIKYEFWYHYLNELKSKNIPSYLVSGIFRKSQVFFKFYGKWYLNILRCFTHLYVQDRTSVELLQSKDILNNTLAGDTRFDRVTDTVKNIKSIDIAEKFGFNSFVLIAGSSWESDEQIFIRYINESENEQLKIIIAPHEIHSSHIQSIEKELKVSYIKFSEAEGVNLNDKKVLIIDNIGMLSSLYQYASVAYIGGGFGKGIHNTLEAATFGMPIIFGSKYQKFKEAVDMLEQGAAFTIDSYTKFKEVFDKLISNEEFLKSSGEKAKAYVEENIGATAQIIKDIF